VARALDVGVAVLDQLAAAEHGEARLGARFDVRLLVLRDLLLEFLPGARGARGTMVMSATAGGEAG